MGLYAFLRVRGHCARACECARVLIKHLGACAAACVRAHVHMSSEVFAHAFVCLYASARVCAR
jgi:hypothetical protein